MRNETEPTESANQYAGAYAAHYTTKDLHKAIDLYKAIMAAHPNTKEAEYSRTQIQNIAKSVVPNERLLDAQVELALTCLRSQSMIDKRVLVRGIARLKDYRSTDGGDLRGHYQYYGPAEYLDLRESNARTAGLPARMCLISTTQPPAASLLPAAAPDLHSYRPHS